MRFDVVPNRYGAATQLKRKKILKNANRCNDIV